MPDGYNFYGTCQPRQFSSDYQPPFIDPINLRYVQQGMQGAITFKGGTVYDVDQKFNISVDQEPVKAGKTGTAEYCDDLAAKQLLCHPGNWPSHAWFSGYAPYPDPEIIVVGFVYNAGEGSFNAKPIVSDVIDCYYHLKAERLRKGLKGQPSPCTINQVNIITEHSK